MIDSPSRRSSRRASALNAGEKNGSALDVSRSPGRDARSRASAKAEVKTETEETLGRGKRARTERAGSAETKSGGATTTGRAGSRTPKRGKSIEREEAVNGTSDGKGENGATKKSAIVSVLGVEAPRVAGRRTPRKPSSAYANFERAAEVLVSLSPQINREAVRAAQQASPARNYAKNQIIDLALGKPVTPRRKRARALFPDEDFSSAPAAKNGSPGRGKKSLTTDEDTLFGALDGLMTLADNVSAEQVDTLKKKRKPSVGRSRAPNASPSRHLPPLPKYKPLPVPVGKKMLKMIRPRRHISREIESVGLGAASSLFGDHRLSETAGTTDSRGDNRARLLIGAHDPLTKRWANANFFTAGTDKTWFNDNSFARWLESIGKGDVRTATRGEWRKIRQKLPKARRLSLKFLKDERLDLEYCRHAARELTRLKLQGKGMTEELETKIAEWTCGLKVAPPLEVGQTVLAVHPRFHSPYMGNILIVERSRCRVQFARPELGVELVRDVDIMPVNVTTEEMDLIAAGTAEQVENEAFTAGFRGTLDPMPAANGHAYGAGVAVAAQMREIDVRLLNEAHQAIERKRELVDALREKNDAAEEFKNKPERVRLAAETNGEALKFQREYAAVVLSLRDANAELEAALLRLRQQQGHHDRPLALWRKIKSQNVGDSQRNLSRFAPPSVLPTSDEVFASTAEDIVATAGMGARRIVYRAQRAGAAGAESTVVLNPSLEEPLAAGSSAANASVPTSASPDADPDKVKVTQLITAIVQATLTVKACADHGASAEVLDACLRRVSDSLRPVAVSNRHVFNALEKALRDLREVFLVR